MDKISGIIPSSPRLKSVDMKEAAPVRPGTPTFGRPEGLSSLAKNKLSETTTAERGASVQADLAGWKAKDVKHAEIASKMSNSFFMKNRQEAEPVMPNEERMPAISSMDRPVKSNPAGFKTDEVGSLRATGSSGSRAAVDFDTQDNDQEFIQPQGLYPKGSFIDRTA